MDLDRIPEGNLLCYRWQYPRKKLKPIGPNVWDQWHSLPRLVRNRCALEFGVSFFVAMLECLGAKTKYSCEGHPDGFYLLFQCSLEVITKIKAATPASLPLRFDTSYHKDGLFLKANARDRVRHPDALSYRLGIKEWADFTHEDRLYILRALAAAWEAAFGSFDFTDSIWSGTVKHLGSGSQMVYLSRFVKRGSGCQHEMTSRVEVLDNGCKTNQSRDHDTKN